MKQSKSIKDYLKKTFLKYTVIIILLLLFVFLISLYVVFNYSVMKVNREAGKALKNELIEEFEGYREGIKELSLNKKIVQALENNEVDSHVNKLLYEFKNSRNISSNFVLINGNEEIVSTSFHQDDEEILSGHVFLRLLANELNQIHYKEQTIHNRIFGESRSYSYYFSTAISNGSENIGYIIFFIDDFIDSSVDNQLVYITDQYDNVIAKTNNYHIDSLGKFFVDNNQRLVKIDENYFYMNKQPAMNNQLNIITLSIINVYRNILIFGMATMLISSFIIFLIARVIIPKIFKKTLQPLNALITIISNGNHKDIFNKSTEVVELNVIYKEYTSKIEKIRDLIQKNEEITEKKRILEIKHLEAKFNPHFLYNALEMIKYEITLNPENASDIVVKIAKLMRYNTNFGNTLVPLKVDLEYLINYCEIQKLRYGRRLEFEIDIPGDLLEIPIPKLILQPLIENAIKHNIDYKNSLKIILTAQKSGDHLVIKVIDNGLGIKEIELENLKKKIYDKAEDVDEVRQIGLKSTQSILQLLYGEKYGLKIESSYNEGSEFSLDIPLKGANNIE
ncbi:histidine kinase [Oceanobacillus sp. FSL W8-0428]|uniref:sensor histidine kinase n=1 Tax=Oceanobacillus TaxID=182709 RepID=UPI000988864B|nr:histidine kinase [Oceanobacillus sojae]MCT1902461.1 histidine kinase [Oceanobacillus sojae]